METTYGFPEKGTRIAVRVGDEQIWVGNFSYGQATITEAQLGSIEPDRTTVTIVFEMDSIIVPEKPTLTESA